MAAGRGAALRDSMRKVLQSKLDGSAASAASSTTCPQAPEPPACPVGQGSLLDSLDWDVPSSAGAEAAGPIPSAEHMEQPAEGASGPAPNCAEPDPWPELRLSATPLGVEDCAHRAQELRRRGDLAGAVRMCAKARYLGRCCSPALAPMKLAELVVDEAEASARMEDWSAAADACRNALDLAGGSRGSAAAAILVRAHSCSARARLELGDVDGARADVAAVHSQIALQDCDSETWEAVQAEVATVEARLPFQAPHVQGNDSRGPSQSGLHSAVACNQAFFDKMEKEYSRICAEDGWDEVQQTQQRMYSQAGQQADQIPAESDYFRAQLPAGPDRELRCGNSAGAPVPSAAVPARPRRNLDELRRVEAATREALEREAARSEGPVFNPPIRTSSETVVVDSLSDSEDEEAEMVAARAGALATFEALQEFERIGREKQERLAKWRDRWG
mmetsp:Transcript_55426/g.161848  ORF Transcript_55426/g.161848 Transcript_55426/m.161848 type:complete len:447 (+) Transcript_55426:76-1416(+)